MTYEKNVQQTYHLPVEIVAIIKQRAAISRRTVSAELTTMLIKYLETQNKNNQQAIALADEGSLRLIAQQSLEKAES